MNRKNKIYSGVLTLLFFIALTSIALSPAGQWVGNTVSGFLNPATEDLDMANNNIKMGTGLIGYDDTASKGLSFDSGNEKVTLESGQLILPAGSAAAPSIGWTDTGFYESSDDTLSYVINGTQMGVITNASIQGRQITGSGFYIANNTAYSGTVPCYAFRGDTNTGVSRADANQPCITGGGLEGLRVIPKADTDSDTDDVFLTGISGFHGKVLVRSITDNTSAFYRISNTTVHDDGLDGDHTSTKDTGSHYNFYYETDQFKLQNKVGDNKSVSVVFWVLPT